MDKTKAFFQDIQALGARVTGSFATGKQTGASDIDFYLSYSKFPKLKRILKKHGISWGSITIAYIDTMNRYNPILPRPIEFNMYYKKLAEKLEEVDIYGVKFKTR